MLSSICFLKSLRPLFSFSYYWLKTWFRRNSQYILTRICHNAFRVPIKFKFCLRKKRFASWHLSIFILVLFQESVDVIYTDFHMCKIMVTLIYVVEFKIVLLNIQVFSYKKSEIFLTKFPISENINQINWIQRRISLFCKAEDLADASLHKQILTLTEFFTIAWLTPPVKSQWRCLSSKRVHYFSSNSIIRSPKIIYNLWFH